MEDKKVIEFNDLPAIEEIPKAGQFNMNDEQAKLLIDKINQTFGVKLSLPKESFRTKEIINHLDLQYKFRFNTITKELEFHNGKSDKFELLDSRGINNIHTELVLNNFRIGKDRFKDLVGSKFVSKDFNPFHEFVNSLPVYESEHDYIRDYLHSVVLEDESERELFVECFRKWVTAAVASWVQDGIANHECLVLVGGEGIYKTTWLNNLLPKKLQIDYLYSNKFDFENKDHAKYLGTKFIVNLDELSSFTKTDQNLIKTVLTETRVVLRLPYGEIDTKMWRKASFCGSSNEINFLKDETSSRRFLVFKVKEISDVRVPIERVYSQAFHLYKSGFRYWFDRDENKTINTRNVDYHSNSIEEELITEYLLIPSAKDEQLEFVDYMSSTAINNYLMSKVNKGNMNETTVRRTGLVLRKLGFKQISKRINNHPTKVWVVKKAESSSFLSEKKEEVF